MKNIIVIISAKHPVSTTAVKSKFNKSQSRRALSFSLTFEVNVERRLDKCQSFQNTKNSHDPRYCVIGCRAARIIGREILSFQIELSSLVRVCLPSMSLTSENSSLPDIKLRRST
jgi:hypothetical protein